MHRTRPTLDELVRRIREIPSPEGRLVGLSTSVALAEQQLAVARHLEPLKLRETLRLNPEHPEDEDARFYDLEQQLTHLLPKLFRGGSILAIWSTLEACTKDLASYAAKVLGKPSPSSFFRGPFVAACEKAVANVAIAPFHTAHAKEELVVLAGVRAVIVHHNSELRSLPKSIAYGDRVELEKAGLYVESDLYHEYFVVTAEFVANALRLVDSHLRSLAERVRTAAPLPPK
jgi:hypothetical protein